MNFIFLLFVSLYVLTAISMYYLSLELEEELIKEGELSDPLDPIFHLIAAALWPIAMLLGFLQKDKP